MIQHDSVENSLIVLTTDYGGFIHLTSLHWADWGFYTLAGYQ